MSTPTTTTTGTAYRCELDGAELTVAEIGTFTYGGSGTPDDFQDVEPEPTADVSVLAGDWYQDGDVDGDSRLEITADGVWTLLDCTDDMDAMMDYGELIPSQEEGSWFARSTMLDDVEYNVTVADENILYWAANMIATSAPRAEEQYKKRGPADRSSLFMACALLYIRMAK